MPPKEIESKPQVGPLVNVPTLQRWALALSQGDMSPRYEIERLLTANGHPTRDPNT